VEKGHRIICIQTTVPPDESLPGHFLNQHLAAIHFVRLRGIIAFFLK